MGTLFNRTPCTIRPCRSCIAAGRTSWQARASYHRARRLDLLGWLFAVLSIVLVAFSFPVEGLYGVGLALAGVAAAIVAIRLSWRAQAVTR